MNTSNERGRAPDLAGACGNHGASGLLTLILALALAVLAPLGTMAAPSPGSAGHAAAAVDPPPVTAASVFSFDAASGIVLYESAPDERMPIGSLTKVATALVVMKYGDMSDEVEIIESDTVDIEVYSNMQLVAGDTLTVGTLLYGLLIPSGTDGANALARHVGSQISGSDDPTEAMRAFVQAMNEDARALGLENTQFCNPGGEDCGERAYSTARDVAILFRELMRNERLAGIVREPAYSFTSVGSSPTQYQGESTNRLLGQQGVVGGKTGSTGDAGGCVVLAREVNGGNLVITAILGSDLTYEDNQIADDMRWNDASTIFTDMDERFAWTTPGAEGTFPGLAEELAVWQMEFVDPPMIPYPGDDEGNASYQLVLGAPVERGEQGGEVHLYFDDIEVGRIPVYQAG